MSFLSLASPMARAHPLNNGRVSWWLNLPGSRAPHAKDLCVRGNRGAFVNMDATNMIGASGRPGGYGAWKFDGSTEYIDCGTGGGKAWEWAQTDDWSFGCWFKPTGTGGLAAIVNRELGRPTWQFLYHGQDSAGSRGVNLSYQFNGGSPGDVNLELATDVLDDGKWHHVFGTCHVVGANRVTNGFHNGMQVASVTNSQGGSAVMTGTKVLMGAGRSASLWRYFPGYVDDFTVYRRRLSKAEVKMYYEESRQGHKNTLNWEEESYGISVDAPVTAVGNVFASQVFG